jgi:glycerol-3-phosphate dehydrogenase
VQYDLLIVGGGINGCAIAREASLLGLKVLLVEKDDLAGHTSSASTKLIHGGLRYLETYEFRLVREALHERERLLDAAPHLIRPLTFVLPHAHSVRPWWVVRLGLHIYDLLAGGIVAAALARASQGRQTLYRSAGRGASRLRLFGLPDGRCPADAGQRDRCRGARRRDRDADRAAQRQTRRRSVARRAVRRAHDRGARAGQCGRSLGCERLLDKPLSRLARRSGWSKAAISSSRKLFEGDHAYILQQPDRRIVFAIPYEGELHRDRDDRRFRSSGPRTRSALQEENLSISCEAVNRYFTRQITPQMHRLELVRRPAAARRRGGKGTGSHTRLCSRARSRRPASSSRSSAARSLRRGRSPKRRWRKSGRCWASSRRCR